MKEKLYTGLMGSGKSEKLISMVEHNKESSLVLNAVFEGSTGVKGLVTSRNGKSVESLEILAEKDTQPLERLLNGILSEDNIKSIYIDEIQFLTIEQIDFIRDYFKLLSIDVIYFGLTTDFKGEMFPSTYHLLGFLKNSDLVFLKRKCELCNNTAEFNARIVNGKVQHKGDLFAKQKAMYKALCKYHYYKM